MITYIVEDINDFNLTDTYLKEIINKKLYRIITMLESALYNGYE